MSDFLQQEKKSEEIFVSPVHEDRFLQEQARSVEEQRQRFEEAKKAKQAQKAAEPPMAGKVEEQQKEVILAEINELVEENIPPRYIKRENDREGIVDMPEEFRTELTNIISWANVNENSSGPVQAAARALLYSKGEDKEQYKARVQNLINVSNTYLSQKRNQWHWFWGDGRRRMRSVSVLIAQAQGYLDGREAAPVDARDKKAKKATTERMIKESQSARTDEEKALIRHYHALEVASLLSEDVAEETDMSEGKELTKREFQKAVSALKDFEPNEIRFKKTDEILAFAAQNADLLKKWDKVSDTFDRGLAMELSVDYEDLEKVMYNRKMLDRIRDHIDLIIRFSANYYSAHKADEAETNDPEYATYLALLDEMKKDTICRMEEKDGYPSVTADMEALRIRCMDDMETAKNQDYEELNRFHQVYGQKFAFDIRDSKERFAKYKELGLFEDPVIKKQYEEMKRQNIPDPDYKITRYIDINLRGHGDLRVVLPGKSIEKDSEDFKVRRLRYIQRTAKGKLIERSEKEGERKASALSSMIVDLNEGKQVDTAEMKALLTGLIIKDAKEYSKMTRAFINNPEKYMARVKQLKVVSENLPVLIEHASRLGISEAQINALISSKAMCDDVMDRNISLVENYRSPTGCAIETEDLKDDAYRDSLDQYVEHLENNKNEDVVKEAEKIRGVFINYKAEAKLEEQAPEFDFLQHTVDATETILDNLNEQMDGAWTDFDRSKPFTEEAYRKYKERWNRTYRTVDAYYEKVGIGLIPKDQDQIIEMRQKARDALKEQKTHFDSLDYKQTVKELFLREHKTLDHKLRNFYALYKHNEIYTQDRFEADKNTVKKLLQDFSDMCGTQRWSMQDMEGAEDTVGVIAGFLKQSDDMLKTLNKLDYDTYLDMSASGFVGNWHQLCTYDHDPNSRLLSERDHSNALVAEYRKRRENGELPPVAKVADGDIVNMTTEYRQQRKETHPMNAAKAEFTEKLKTVLALPDEEFDRRMAENDGDWGQLLPEKINGDDLIITTINKAASSVTIDDVLKKRDLGGLGFSAIRSLRLGGDDTPIAVGYLIKLAEDPVFAKEVGLTDENLMKEMNEAIDKLMVYSTLMEENYINIGIKLNIDTANLSESKKKLVSTVTGRYDSTENAARENLIGVYSLHLSEFLSDTMKKLLDRGVEIKFEKAPGTFISYKPELDRLETIGGTAKTKEIDIKGHKLTIDSSMEIDQKLLNADIDEATLLKLQDIASEYSDVHTKRMNLRRFVYDTNEPIDTSDMSEEDKKLVKKGENNEYRFGSLRAFSAYVEYKYLDEAENRILSRFTELQKRCIGVLIV